jgi:hypothetical protein
MCQSAIIRLIREILPDYFLLYHEQFFRDLHFFILRGLSCGFHRYHYDTDDHQDWQQVKDNSDHSYCQNDGNKKSQTAEEPAENAHSGTEDEADDFQEQNQHNNCHKSDHNFSFLCGQKKTFTTPAHIVTHVIKVLLSKSPGAERPS